MKYKVDKSSRPVYMQIYRQIKEDIINGIYPYNTKLPSKRLLADETRTSTVTIEHAYALLQDTDMSISEICFESGFQSIRSFNQVCRETYGMSPKELKRL